MRIRGIDVFEPMLCKGKHCSNTLQAFTRFILTSLRGKSFTDEETEAQSNYITYLRSHS